MAAAPLHPILLTLARVHSYLRDRSSIELRAIARACELNPDTLRHARDDGWQPKLTTLARLDAVVPHAASGDQPAALKRSTAP